MKSCVNWGTTDGGIKYGNFDRKFRNSNTKMITNKNMKVEMMKNIAAFEVFLFAILWKLKFYCARMFSQEVGISLRDSKQWWITYCSFTILIPVHLSDNPQNYTKTNQRSVHKSPASFIVLPHCPICFSRRRHGKGLHDRIILQNAYCEVSNGSKGV